MRCPNCQTINPTNAKFCLECGNRLVVCPTCGTVNLPFAKFCIECGTALQSTATDSAYLTGPLPLKSEQTILPIVESTAVPAQILAADDVLAPPEERRIVTIMFADITGSTPLADRLDPEDMRAILTGYFNLMTEQIRKHGGTVEKYIGDAVMAIFGIPGAHEDDPDRAIRAALDMQQALNQFNEIRLAQDTEARRLQMRIGINTGEVAAPSRAHRRQDFLITGDAVNVAARLQQTATPDTILVGERTYLATRDIFDFRAIAPLHVKGKPEPIAARVVTGLRQHTPAIAQHPRGIEGHPAPLIGRTLELMLMHASYARVQAERRPYLITILGTPGIGKSRLVREFIAREQEAVKSASTASTLLPPKVLIGRCPPYGEGITYWPLIEILRSLLGAHEDESDEYLQGHFGEFVRKTLEQAGRNEAAEEISNSILRRIGRGLGHNNHPGYLEQSQRTASPPTHSAGSTTSLKQSGTEVALLRAWRVLLEALAEQQPLIIVIDDLQWADEALLEFLEYLTERITNKPILFLCPARPDFFERRRDWGGGKRNFTTIELDTLSREESSELVDALLNTHDLPEMLRQTILARSEDNPFFIEEIVRMLIDQGILIRQEGETGSWHLCLNNELPGELSTPIEYPEDSLLNMHYLLPLPRVPDTVQGVLAARVDLLDPTEKLVLQHAAIVGRTFWLSSLLELGTDLTIETILAALVSLIQRDFIIEAEKQIRSPVEQDRTFLFKHVLIRDVVYNNIPRQRRSQEHAHVACWLEKQTEQQQEAFIELLAYHYQHALAYWPATLEIKLHSTGRTDETQSLTRDELRQRAVTYLVLAGDQAMHSYYTMRAVQAYTDALELLNSESGSLEYFKMQIRLGDAYAQRHSEKEALHAYREALRLAQEEQFSVEPAQLIMLYERLAMRATRWMASFSNDPSAQEIRSYIDAGLQLLNENEISRERAAFLTYLALWYLRNFDSSTDAAFKKVQIEQGLASAQQALAMAEQLNDPNMLSLALDAVGFLYSKLHTYHKVEALQHRRLLLEHQLTDRHELFDIYVSLGHVHEKLADYPNALMWFGRAWSIAQTMESPSMLLHSMSGRMRTWRSWNRWEEATQVAKEMLHIIERYQLEEKQQLWALETLVTIAYRTGQYEETEQYSRQYQRLLDQQLAHLDKEEKKLFEAKRHSIHLTHEDWEQSRDDYRFKLAVNEPFPSPEVLSTLAELLVITDADPIEQAEMCERAVQEAERSGARKSLAIALRARGRMYTKQQKWRKAEDSLRQALQRCEVLDLLWERGNTLDSLGLLYKNRAASYSDEESARRTADLGRARYHFEQAVGFFEALHAEPSVQRIRNTLSQNNLARV